MKIKWAKFQLEMEKSKISNVKRRKKRGTKPEEIQIKIHRIIRIVKFLNKRKKEKCAEKQHLNVIIE